MSSAAAKLANIKLGGAQQQSTGSVQTVKPPVPSKPSHFDIANKFVESVQDVEVESKIMVKTSVELTSVDLMAECYCLGK